MSHSKRNTSRAFFTAHERTAARTSWGSQATRLTRDSFLPFGSCQLCLLPASDPVACAGCPVTATPSTPSSAIVVSENPASEAVSASKKRKIEPRPITHIFCRECAISNLLAQKQELKRLSRLSSAQRAEAEEVARFEEEEAKARAVEEFERVQAGLDAKLPPVGGKNGRRIVGRENGKIIVEEDVPPAGGVGGRGVLGEGKSQKRKFELDEAELLRIAEEDTKKARKLLDDEKERDKKEAPGFWLPSQAPAAGAGVAVDVKGKEKKQQPLCPGSTPATPHPISLKSLTPVCFSEEGGPENRSTSGTTSADEVSKSPAGVTRTCPSCSRALSNASKAVLLKPCGHVVCGPCVDKFMLGDAKGEHAWDDSTEDEETVIRCFVCTEDVTPRPKAAKKDKKKSKKADVEDEKEKGMFDIACEGTGFAGGGKNYIKKDGVAFQC